jgi:hypothetical protein
MNKEFRVIIEPEDSPDAENTAARIVSSRPDTEVAEELKAELTVKIRELCLILDKATAAGFHAVFSVGPRWDGKQDITSLTIAKHY